MQAEVEIVDRDIRRLFRAAVIRTVAETRQIENRFAQGLGGNGPLVEAGAAQMVYRINNHHFFSELSRLYGPF